MKLACLALLLGISSAAAQEPVDRAMIAKFKDEGQNRSKVAATFNHLTNVVGPRLTGTPAYKQAADWAEAQLKSYGLSAVHQESWPFGRGWGLDKLILEMVEQRYRGLLDEGRCHCQMCETRAGWVKAARATTTTPARR